jgi:esterase/lipase superfamily enzyme
MLIITNRKQNVIVTNQTGGKAFTSKFSSNGSDLSIADVSNTSGNLENPEWLTQNVIVNATDIQIKKRITEYANNALSNGRSILVYIHGNNNNFEKMLDRCHFLSQTYEAVEVIGFSWPSEGFLPTEVADLSQFDTAIGDDDGLSDEKKYKSWFSEKSGRYLQAKKNAASSAKALDRCLARIADIKASPATTSCKFSLTAHSLGCELLHQTIIKSSSDLAQFCNVIFLAPAVTASAQHAMLANLAPQKKVYVMFNKNDWILAASSFVDGDIKLGVDPKSAPPPSSNAKVRYVDFEGAAGGAGHRYFLEGETLDMVRHKRFKVAKRLFDRVFACKDDIAPGEGERGVYPLGCDSTGKTCFMGSGTVLSANDSLGG